MKKKRILLGIALASASIFALASCGESKNDPAKDDETKDTSGGDQNPGGNEGQGQGGGQQTETKYSVTYNVNGHGTAPANKTDVTAITDADLTAISAPGYIFEGWFTDAALTQAAAAGNISTNTTLYAKWYGASYDAVKAKGNVALDETFDDDSMNIRNYSYNRSIFQQNIYFISSVHTEKPNSPKTNYRYSLANGIFTLVDEDASSGGDTKGSAKAVINFGDTTNSKILEGYVDVTIPVKNNSWTFFQLYGTDTAKNNNEIFGLRTVEEGSGSDKKTYIQYRVDGTVTSTGIINKLEVTDNTSFGIHMIIDQVAGTISVDFVKADGTVLPYIKDVAIPGYKISTRYLFTSTDASNKVLSFDNVLLRGEGTIDDVETYKAKVMAYYVPYLDEVGSFYVTNAAQYAAAKEALIAAVEAATTKDAINALIDVSSPQTASPEMIALMSIEDEWSIVSNYIQTNYPSTNYTINSEAFQQAYNAYFAAETAEQLIAAKDGFASIVPDAAAKVDYIAEKVAAFQTSYPATDYTYEDNDYNNKAAYNALVATITGNNKYEIDATYNTAIVQAPGIPTNAALLDSAKTNYKNSLSSYRTDLTGKDLDSSDETAVAAYYNGDNFTARVTAGQTAIENADSLTNVRAAYETFKAAVDTDINGIVLSKEDLTTQFNTTLAEMKTAAKEEIESSTIDGYVDAVAALVASDYDDKAALTTAYNAKVALIEKYVAWDASVSNTVSIYREYAYEQRETKCLDKSVPTYGEQCVKVLSDYFKTRLTDLFAIEYGTATYDETIAAFIETTKAEIDAIIAEYRANTEVTVTFKKFADDTTAYETVTIVKNTIVPAPETDPTDDTYAFAGWDFDFTAAISSDTVILAKWYDTAVKTKTTTIDEDLTTGTRPGYVDADTHPNTVVSQDIITYKFNADQTKDVIMDNGTISGLGFNDCSKADGTRYIQVVLASSGKIKFGVGNYTDNVGYVSVGTAMAQATKDDAGAITIPKKKDNTGLTLFESEILPAGTYYINWSRKQLLFNYITVELYEEVTYSIKGITATVLEDDGMITIDDIKLIDTSDNEIAINNGVDVEVRNSGNNVVDDLTQPLPAGTYTVYIKYGTYTVYTKEVTIKHTVTINGTEYKIADGETLGTNLPASATKTDKVDANEIITKYSFVCWEDANHNIVYSSTVVTSDMVITPKFSETYAVNTFVGLQNTAGDGSVFSLDGDIELTADINVDYSFILDTKTYSFTGTGKFILDTNGEIISSSDISAFVGAVNGYKVDKAVGQDEYTFTVSQIVYTVMINGTEYNIAHGGTLGTNLPASATKADEVDANEIITKYTFTGWQDADGNDVDSSTVVTSDMVITPKFDSTYAVNTFAGLQNAIATKLDSFSLDGNIELTDNINVDYTFSLDTKTYSFTGTGKFIIGTNGGIMTSSDITAFIEF